jgi:hypothetical protein
MHATLILLVLGATSGATIVDVAEVRRATSQAPVVAAARRMEQQVASGVTDALVAEIRAVLADPTLDPVAREWLVDSALQSLRTLPATAAARALARDLSARAPRVYTQVEPEHGRHVVPLYDTGATARYALREWTRRDAREDAVRSLRLGTMGALEAYLGQGEMPGSDAVRDGVLDAYGLAAPEVLHRQRPTVVAALQAGRDVDRIALLLARRLRDAELFSLTIGHASPAVALAGVQTVVQDLDPDSALAVLAEAADREPVASAALLSIGRLASTDATGQQLLLDRLTDPVSGESAAAALAGVDDPGLAVRLGARLQATADEGTRRRIVLALKLSGSAAARNELVKLVDAGKGSVELRKEVAAWLARGR